MIQIFELVGKFLFDDSEGNEKFDELAKKAEKLGKEVQTAGDKIAGVGTKMLPVTVAIGGIGAVAVKASAEVKAMNSQFEQTFGELQDSASDTMNRVATESGILQTRLQGVGTSIYAFAKSSGADSAEALQLMETALKATADASAYYDRSLEDTSESLMSFLKGNFANDAQLGVSCTETTRNAKAMELFGQKYNDLSEIQKQQTLLKMVTDAQALSGAMGQASRESDGFENVTGNLKESVKQLSAEFGEVLLPTVVSLIQKATAFMQKLSEMDDGTKKMIVTLALVVGAIAPVLIVVGKVISSVGTIITLFPKVMSGVKLVGTGLKTLWGIMLANPISIVITVIGALVAGFIYLWNTSDEFRQFWIDLWGNIKEVCSVAIEAITGFFNKVIDFVKNNWQGLLLLLVNPFAGAFKLIYDNCDGFKKKVDDTFEKVKNAVRNGIDKIKSFLNFDWSLPKLKMPHFSISGEFSLNPPSVPKLGIEWYAKGGIMTEPTAFGINPNTGSVMVGGEAGAEAIAPIDTLLGYVRTAVSEENLGLLEVLHQMLNKMGENVGDIVVPVYIGNNIIDELIVDSKRRLSVRSGGLVNV